MRGGGEEDQRVRARGEQLGGARAQRVPALAGAALGDVVGFVDDDDVPPGVFEVGAVFAVLFQGVDGDDRLVEVVERVVVRGDVPAHFLEAGGIKAGERDGEAGPDFLLKLGQHGLDGDDQDAAAPAAFAQLGEQDPAFDGFPETDSIGDEEALAGLGEGEQRRVELIGQHVHGPAVAEVDGPGFRGGRPQVGFEDQAGLRVAGAGIPDRPGMFGIDDGDFAVVAFDRVDEPCLLAFDQRGEPDDPQNGGPGGCAVDAADQPFLIADGDSAAGGVGEGGGHRTGKNSRQCTARQPWRKKNHCQRRAQRRAGTAGASGTWSASRGRGGQACLFGRLTRTSHTHSTAAGPFPAWRRCACPLPGRYVPIQPFVTRCARLARPGNSCASLRRV
jgi:hypothetical protein